ncbi:unnamed protein product [Ixodes pacificus]
MQISFLQSQVMNAGCQSISTQDILASAPFCFESVLSSTKAHCNICTFLSVN